MLCSLQCSARRQPRFRRSFPRCLKPLQRSAAGLARTAPLGASPLPQPHQAPPGDAAGLPLSRSQEGSRPRDLHLVQPGCIGPSCHGMPLWGTQGGRLAGEVTMLCAAADAVSGCWLVSGWLQVLAGIVLPCQLTCLGCQPDWNGAPCMLQADCAALDFQGLCMTFLAGHHHSWNQPTFCLAARGQPGAVLQMAGLMKVPLRQTAFCSVCMLSRCPREDKVQVVCTIITRQAYRQTLVGTEACSCMTADEQRDDWYCTAHVYCNCQAAADVYTHM